MKTLCPTVRLDDCEVEALEALTGKFRDLPSSYLAMLVRMDLEAPRKVPAAAMRRAKSTATGPRSSRIGLRVTEEMHAAALERADELGTSWATYVRALLWRADRGVG